MSLRRKEKLGGNAESYETPAWAVHRLLEARHFGASPGRWIEPACGSGRIVRAVDEVLTGVEWTENDIVRPDGVDFLAPESFNGEHFACCITNPPFSLACEFVAKARQIADTVFMLLPLSFAASNKRANFFSHHMPDRIFVLPDRPHWVDPEGYFIGPGPMADVAWFAWYRDGLCNLADGKALLERLAATPAGIRKACGRKRGTEVPRFDEVDCG